MTCEFCHKEITTEEPFFYTKTYIKDTHPENCFRAGWWFFHVKCWLEIMEKVNCNPNIPFPKFEAYLDPNWSHQKEEQKIINEFAEKIALDIESEIIMDLLKGKTE